MSTRPPPKDKPPVTTLSQQSDKDLVEFAFFTEIAIVDQLVRNRIEKHLTDGLSMAQFSLLTHFYRLGGRWNLVRLARAFQVSKPAMTKIVHKLEQKGFVGVEPDPDDGRGKLVGLTQAGDEAWHRAILTLMPLVEEFRSRFTYSELKQTLPLLQSIRTWLDENR